MRTRLGSKNNDRMARHVATLAATWDAFAAGAGANGRVIRETGFVASLHRYDVFNNALLLTPNRVTLDAVRSLYRGVPVWRVWTADADTDSIANACGYTPVESTRPMWCLLDALPVPPRIDLVADADPALVADINGRPPAESLYARLGFTAVGRWQEWAPPP